MISGILLGVIALLVANVVLALIVIGRRRPPNGWLLVILLTGTTGAAATGVFAAWDSLQTGQNPDTARWPEVALLFTGLAVLGTTVWFSARRSIGADTPSGNNEKGRHDEAVDLPASEQT